jgi:hypothetical protein
LNADGPCARRRPISQDRKARHPPPKIRAAEPDANTRFEAGDVVVLLGEPTSLAAAEGRLLKG